MGSRIIARLRLLYWKWISIQIKIIFFWNESLQWSLIKKD